MEILFLCGLVLVVVGAAYAWGEILLGLAFGGFGMLLLVAVLGASDPSFLPLLALLFMGASAAEFIAASALRETRRTRAPTPRGAVAVAEVVGVAGYTAIALLVLAVLQFAAWIASL